MAALSGIKPEKVFYYFEQLCSVPHGSGNTKRISDLCVGFAKELGLKYRQEACNNLIIWKDGSKGYENAAPVILQGHIDMVCAKTEDCTRTWRAMGSMSALTANGSGRTRRRLAATTASPLR